MTTLNDHSILARQLEQLELTGVQVLQSRVLVLTYILLQLHCIRFISPGVDGFRMGKSLSDRILSINFLPLLLGGSGFLDGPTHDSSTCITYFLLTSKPQSGKEKKKKRLQKQVKASLDRAQTLTGTSVSLRPDAPDHLV